ncbi:right-handed parallel beta-helix repeat-containing protein [Phytohabitans houttuyneae]|uniref:Right handed beta helix domain-containing protein n=1 Tax=Phytohabitans houttuyneae TaxID=1076126 RepID=A0A6V8KFJ3_9ACTN|nr:right-handed parallel beta-helix repeat-containing protein [Phytohabitans houttuyneae]GFJ83982.1 hypothetical protein Phou_081620 [Phytohabitans houttuyneae]
MRAALFVTAAVGAVTALFPPPAAAAAPDRGRVIVVRPGQAQLVRDGAVHRTVSLPRGAVTIAALVHAVRDPSWVALSPHGEVSLRAGLTQRPGTELYVRAPARTLRLVDSATSPAYLTGTRARVYFRGVTVTSAPAAGDRPAPESKHRPYLRYLNRSTVSIVSSTFEGLGAAGTRNHGVTVGAGGVLKAVDSTFRAGSRGIDVYRAARVSLTRVRAAGNTEAGILVNQAGALSLTDVAASDNAGTGLVLRGPLRAPVLTRVASAHNGTGVELSRLGGVPVGPLRTVDNRGSGIVLDRCPGCVVDRVEASGDRTGILVKRGSGGSTVSAGTVRDAERVGVMVAAAGVRLRGMTVESGPVATGLRVPPTVTGARVESSAFRGGALAISTDGEGTAIADTTITGAGTGIRIGGHATAVTLTGVRLDGSRTAVQANTGSRTVTAERLRIVQRGGQGLRSAAEGMSIVDSDVDGAALGMHLKGIATVRLTSVSATDQALYAGPGASVTFTRGRLDGAAVGVRAHALSAVVLEDTSVEAPTGARGPVRLTGTTELPAMPVRWIALLGLLVVAAAITLEVLRRLRERREERTVTAPDHVANTA